MRTIVHGRAALEQCLTYDIYFPIHIIIIIIISVTTAAAATTETTTITATFPSLSQLEL